MEEKAKILAELLKVLANENRLLILCNLIDGPMTVGQLFIKLSNITRPALSQHLALLKAHKILDSHKNGLSVSYFINDMRILSVMKVLKDNYCEK